MKHYRSTLAVAGFAVLGLVGAARILHPVDDSPQTARVTAAVTAAPPAAAAPIAAEPAAWIDPPARSAAPETTGTIRREARAEDADTSIVQPPGQSFAQSPGSASASPAAPRKATAGPRSRAAAGNPHRAARLRHAAVARIAVQPPQTAPQPPAPMASSKIDPIGDIIRGLGFGRDG
jgi:hypothetical protein